MRRGSTRKRLWLALCLGLAAGACTREHGMQAPAGSAGAGRGGRAAGDAGTAATGTGGGSGGEAGRAPRAGEGGTVSPQTPRPALPFVPGKCTVRSLDAASQCVERDRATCPVELAGELDCEGSADSPDVMFDGRYLYAALSFGGFNEAPSTIVGVRIDPSAPSHAVHRIDLPGHALWRLDDGAPVLLAFDPGTRQLTPMRPDADFGLFDHDEARAIEGTPFDAYFDDGGLHVWSRRVPPLSLLLDGRVITESAGPHAATLSSAGAPLLAFMVSDPTHLRLRTWTQAEGERELRAFSLSTAALPFGNLDVVAYPHAAEQRIVSWEAGGQIATAGARIDLPEPSQSLAFPDCNGTMTAYAPNLCPTTTRKAPFSERVIAHRLIADERAGPWVLSVHAQGETECKWLTVGACYESRPCDCVETGQPEFSQPVLVLQSLSEQVQLFRLPLTGLPVGAIAVTEPEDGSFFVTWTYSMRRDGPLHTYLRYLRIRLAPPA